MARQTVLVAGASGLVGAAALRHFAALPAWDVVGVSRRRPPGTEGATFIALDLTDAHACREAMHSMSGVTHLVYAALYEVPGLFAGWVDQAAIERNFAMLRNLCEPLAETAKALRHVSLLHGTKAYGLHHPSIGSKGVKNPLREREPRIPHPNFYFLQEDYLRQKQCGADWTMTVFRPTVIYGDALGNNMNPIPPLATYAALLKDAGEPLHFPGRPGHPVLREAVDADLVAAALGWAATSPEAAGGTFNLTNGDVFLWENIWPAVAESFEMEVGEARPVQLSEWLPAHGEEWAALVAKHELNAPSNLMDFVGYNSVVYTDMVLSGAATPSNPILNSTIAARQAGFHECIDTEDMFRKWFTKLRADRLVP